MATFTEAMPTRRTTRHESSNNYEWPDSRPCSSPRRRPGLASDRHAEVTHECHAYVTDEPKHPECSQRTAGTGRDESSTCKSWIASWLIHRCRSVKMSRKHSFFSGILEASDREFRIFDLSFLRTSFPSSSSANQTFKLQSGYRAMKLSHPRRVMSSARSSFMFGVNSLTCYIQLCLTTTTNTCV